MGVSKFSSVVVKISLAHGTYTNISHPSLECNRGFNGCT
jgi:hypothetical protein